MKKDDEISNKVDIAISVIDHILSIIDHDESVIEDAINNLSEDEVDEFIRDAELPADELYKRVSNLLDGKDCTESHNTCDMMAMSHLRLIEGGLNDEDERLTSDSEVDVHLLEGKESFVSEMNVRRLRMNKKEKGAILYVLLDDGVETRFLGEEIADMISSCARDRLDDLIRNKDVITRLSKSAFLIIQDSNCDFDKAKALADRIVAMFNNPFYVENDSVGSHEINMSAHVGVSVYSYEEDKPSSTICENAELAAYQAKKHALPFLFFEPSIRLEVKRNMILKKEIKEALHSNQFFTMYQPKYDLNSIYAEGCVDSRSLVGFEALIRWAHPRRNETVYPAQFISFVEDSGLIGDVTRNVMKYVFADYRRWIDKGKKVVPVSINFSPNQFEEGGVDLMVSNLLDEYGLSAKLLDIEITEDVFMDLENNQNVRKSLVKLNEMGVSISVDDFGRGYSCLDKIFDIPISRIKIDQKFVSGLPIDRRSFCVVKAAIELAKGMGLEATAEGVEKPEQALTLKKLGCKEAQGFLFSKPISSKDTECYLSAEEVTKEVWLATGR